MAATFETLKEALQIEQRTAPWYARRKQLVTASEAASIVPNHLKYTTQYLLDFPDAKKPKGTYCNPYCSKKEWFLRKTDSRYKFTGNAATEFGQKYEPVAQAIYEHLAQTRIHEYGLIISKKYPFIGASPDGVSEANRMLEIKCPSMREINGIPPIYYYIQMQMQMEVCDFNVCDYLECKIDEYPNRQMFLADSSANYKGCLLAYVGGTKKFVYPPSELMGDPLAQDKWCLDKIRADENDEETVYELVHWRLNKYFLTPVHRRQEWFVGLIVPLLEKAAQLIQKPYIYKIFVAKQEEEGETGADEGDDVEEYGGVVVHNEIDFTSRSRKLEVIAEEEETEAEDVLPDIC